MSSHMRYFIRRISHMQLLPDGQIHVKQRMGMLPTRTLLESDAYLVKLLNCQSEFTRDDWRIAREDLQKFDFIKKLNIDAVITDICLAQKNYGALISYVEYLKSNNIEINLNIATQYVSTLRLHKTVLGEREKKEICAIYDTMRRKYPIFIASSCITFIEALSLTDRWQDSIELLEQMKMSAKIVPTAITAIISAAFHNRRADIGWKYFELAFDEKVMPSAKAYTSYLNYCLEISKSKEELEKNLCEMLEFWQKNGVQVKGDVLQEYVNVLRNHLGYIDKQTTISHSGRCLVCSHQLSAPKITDEEFKAMSELFMGEVLVGENVHYNSTPKEFNSFMAFIKKEVPYDIVIDGLNVAMSGRALPKNSREKSMRLSKAVEYFINEDKKILLLGRQHMLRWKELSYIRHNTKMFLVEDNSADDPYLLYATLYGGMNTCFLSMDFMRQHKHQLPNNMHELFVKWQISHQYTMDSSTLTIRSPAEFQVIAQNDKNGWHIPYFTGITCCNKDTYNPTTNWICLRKK